MRCDVASNGPHEHRAAPSQADFVRCDVAPDGRWMQTWNWGHDTFVTSSLFSEPVNLGPHNGNNCHYVRWIIDRFNLYRVYTPDGKVNKVAHYVSDGDTIIYITDHEDEPPDNSQGILDVTSSGAILFWPAHTVATVDGCAVRDPLTRGIYTICTFQDTYLGASVFVADGPDQGWYRVYEGDTQGLVPRIAENGTAALVVGFISKEDWLTRPFDPHAVVMPPVESVPLLNRVFGFECYTFHDAKTVGNLTMPVRPTVKNWHGVVAPSDRPDIIDSAECWSVYAGENGSYTCEQAIKDARPLAAARGRGLTIYQDSFPMRDSVLALATWWDVGSCLFMLGAEEQIDAFTYRCAQEYVRLSHWDLEGVWPTINVKGDARRAADAFIAVTQLARDQHWPGLRFFAVGRDDVPMAALAPYTSRFMSGITGVPEALYAPTVEDTMISYSVVNVKDSAKSKPENYLTGERKSAGSGFAIKQVTSDPKTNGYYLTITPEGDVSQRPEGNASQEQLDKYVPGAWETFYASGNIAVAEREKGNNGGKPNTVYWFPCVGK